MAWAELGEAARALAEQIAGDGYDPEMILAIARGGLLVGAALGYGLGIKNVYTMNVEYYTGVEQRLEVPRILPPAPDFVDLRGGAPIAGSRSPGAPPGPSSPGPVPQDA